METSSLYMHIYMFHVQQHEHVKHTYSYRMCSPSQAAIILIISLVPIYMVHHHLVLSADIAV